MDGMAVVVNPKNDDIAVMYENRQRTLRWVVIYDAKTKEKRGQFDLPQWFNNIGFTPDGKSLLARSHKNEITIINYRQKVN